MHVYFWDRSSSHFHSVKKYSWKAQLKKKKDVKTAADKKNTGFMYIAVGNRTRYDIMMMMMMTRVLLHYNVPPDDDVEYYELQTHTRHIILLLCIILSIMIITMIRKGRKEGKKVVRSCKVGGYFWRWWRCYILCVLLGSDVTSHTVYLSPYFLYIVHATHTGYLFLNTATTPSHVTGENCCEKKLYVALHTKSGWYGESKCKEGRKKFSRIFSSSLLLLILLVQLLVGNKVFYSKNSFGKKDAGRHTQKNIIACHAWIDNATHTQIQGMHGVYNCPRRENWVS